VVDVLLLDHGYVRYVAHSGSDQSIIEAARMSTDKGFLGWGPKACTRCEAGYITVERPAGWLGDGLGEPGVTTLLCPACLGDREVEGDERLLRRLWQDKHLSPFEMGDLTIEVQAPIFVFREWHRHRTQSYNEMSGRYTVLPDLTYVPSVERLMASVQSTTNKQSSQAGFTATEARAIQDTITASHGTSRANYEALLAAGVAREVARGVLPVGQYSRMRAKANLRNWLGFLALRMASDAQWEIRQYANAVHEILTPLFPRTVALFDADQKR
jgi:thymidylate synthase (FAD)